MVVRGAAPSKRGVSQVMLMQSQVMLDCLGPIGEEGIPGDGGRRGEFMLMGGVKMPLSYHNIK